MDADLKKVYDAATPYLFDEATDEAYSAVAKSVAKAFDVDEDSVAYKLLEDGSLHLDLPDKAFTIQWKIPLD